MSSTAIKRSRPMQCSTKYTSRNFKLYADALTLRDLVTDSGVDAGTWKLKILGAGTLTIRPVNGPADGSLDIALPSLAVGTELPIECSAIVSGTATNILVMW